MITRHAYATGGILTLVALPITALAIPQLNPHPHVLVGFEDPVGGGAARNHTHWDPLFPLYPGNLKPNDEGASEPDSPLASIGKSFVNIAFDAYSAWDQRGNQALYRNGDSIVDFGHGFIAQSVPYSFEAGVNGVPALARADLNRAFDVWENEAETMFGNYRGGAFGPATGRVFGMEFASGTAEDTDFNGLLGTGEDANANGLLDGMTIAWIEGGIPNARARWIPGLQQLQFSGTENWYFGGQSAIPIDEDVNANGRLDPGEDLNLNGVIDGLEWTDFFTIALHELGHVIGLNHINSDEDIDGDGRLDVNEDIDGDGRLDVAEDLNLNGVLDPGEDTDGDGRLDVAEDVDGDGRLDVREIDRDGDGIADNTSGMIMDAFIDRVATPDVAGTFGLRAPDVGSLFGALALYTQVPAPPTLWLVVLALAGMGMRGRKA